MGHAFGVFCADLPDLIHVWKTRLWPQNGTIRYKMRIEEEAAVPQSSSGVVWNREKKKSITSYSTGMLIVKGIIVCRCLLVDLLYQRTEKFRHHCAPTNLKLDWLERQPHCQFSWSYIGQDYGIWWFLVRTLKSDWIFFFFFNHLHTLVLNAEVHMPANIQEQESQIWLVKSLQCPGIRLLGWWWKPSQLCIRIIGKQK